MQYRQKRNNNSKAYIIGVLVLVGLVFLGSRLTPQVALPIANSILKVAHKTGDAVERSFSFLRNGEEASRNKELLQEYKSSYDELSLERELLVSENVMLRRELGLRGTDQLTGVSAAVLSYPPITPFDVILVDAGSVDGVNVGDKVFAGDKIYIGTVSNVARNTAQVALFSTPDRKTEGLVARTETAIVLDGLGGGAFDFTAPEGFDIAVGDLIVTPGSERRALGRVAGIHEEENGSFATVFIEQPINIQNIQWVRITQENQ